MTYATWFRSRILSVITSASPTCTCTKWLEVMSTPSTSYASTTLRRRQLQSVEHEHLRICFLARGQRIRFCSGFGLSVSNSFFRCTRRSA